MNPDSIGGLCAKAVAVDPLPSKKVSISVILGEVVSRTAKTSKL